MATSIDLARRLLAQQTVEKSIKAVLAANETEFPFTHDLEHLKNFSEESGIEFPPTLNGAEALTPFALAERYGSESPIGLDRSQALEWAAAAIAWAQISIQAISAEA